MPSAAPISSPGFVLDSFAILALLGNEPGADEVGELLSAGAGPLLMTYVNLGEVVYTIIRTRGQSRADVALLGLEESGITFVPAERSLTLEAAGLKARHRLSYADAYAAALARLAGFPLVTGDPEFRQLEGQIPIRWLSPPASS
jgi:uncharacterized protein